MTTPGATEGPGAKETARIEAFSDGVFAIAITLLVLELKVPHLEDPTGAALVRALGGQWPSYLSFLCSFLTILIMWVNHHHVFNLVCRSDGRFMYANGLLLLLVTVVPFPTALLAEYLVTPAGKIAAAVYSGLFVLINLGYNLLWQTAVRGDLLHPGVPRSVAHYVSRRFYFGFPCYAAATLLSFVSPYLGVGLCFALWFYWAAQGYTARKSGRS